MLRGETPCPSNRPDDQDRQPRCRRAFGALIPVARIERSEIRDRISMRATPLPGFARAQPGLQAARPQIWSASGPTAFSTRGLRTRFCRISFEIDLGTAADALIE